MAVLKRKNRMISLRLSNEEYESLRNLYRLHGSRSVSDFARSAMQRVITETMSNSSPTVETRLQDLDSKMASLDFEVSRLVGLLESRVPRAQAQAAGVHALGDVA